MLGKDKVALLPRLIHFVICNIYQWIKYVYTKAYKFFVHVTDHENELQRVFSWFEEFMSKSNLIFDIFLLDI